MKAGDRTKVGSEIRFVFEGHPVWQHLGAESMSYRIKTGYQTRTGKEYDRMIVLKHSLFLEEGPSGGYHSRLLL